MTISHAFNVQGSLWGEKIKPQARSDDWQLGTKVGKKQRFVYLLVKILK